VVHLSRPRNPDQEQEAQKMTKKFKLGPLSIDPVAYGSQGNAVLGIRDSGKTYTATYFAERLFDAGVPFIAFDPIGVWRFLRMPGKGHGYPVVVAGGKEGDLPLTEAGAPEIVRAAMRNGVSLVIDLFDINLSKSAWRRIVTSCIRVLLHENASHGLRHVFLEEAAEFIPQKPNDWDVYNEIEKLARMGGNSRLGYTLINQRSQEVSKAILELCENLFLHRQRGKNALENMDKWLQIAGAQEQKELIKSLPDLPQGECWAWLGGDNPTPPTRVKVPEKNSLHPDRRVMHGDKIIKGKKAVDVGDFVAGMKSTLVKVEEEDKANNPKLLRAEIAKLKKDYDTLAKSKGAKAPDPEALRKAEERAFERGKKEVAAAADKRIHDAKVEQLEKLGTLINPPAAYIADELKAAKRDKPKIATAVTFTPAPVISDRAAASIVAPVRPTKAQREKPAASAGDGAITGPEQRILNSLASWAAMGHEQPSNPQVAWLAGYSPTSTGYTNPRSALRTKGLVDYPSPDRVALTSDGASRAVAMQLQGSLLDVVLARLPGPERRILSAAAALYPAEASNDQVATDAGYSPTSTGYTNPRSALKTKELITYPSSGNVRAADWLFAA
jgi:hypothetical protein